MATFLTVLWWIFLVLYLSCCIALITIVLLQKGKGAGFAGAFGVGPGSETIFGPSTARSLPQKLTYIAAGVFMVLALAMSTISGRVGKASAPGTVDETGSPDSVVTVDHLFGDMGAPVADDSSATEAPADATVEETAPAETTAEEAAPAEATVEEAAPADTATEEATVEEAAPAETTADEAAHAETAPQAPSE